SGFIPPMFKRLYWSGHRVMSYQGDATSGYAHTVAALWPGDQGKGYVVPGLGNPTNLVFFPEDEFHALQTGVPLAQLILTLTSETSGSPRQIDVIAHSLGNMAVNSALMLLEPRTVR